MNSVKQKVIATTMWTMMSQAGYLDDWNEIVKDMLSDDPPDPYAAIEFAIDVETGVKFINDTLGENINGDFLTEVFSRLEVTNKEDIEQLRFYAEGYRNKVTCED